jgi:hypothetical protein
MPKIMRYFFEEGRVIVLAGSGCELTKRFKDDIIERKESRRRK